MKKLFNILVFAFILSLSCAFVYADDLYSGFSDIDAKLIISGKTSSYLSGMDANLLIAKKGVSPVNIGHDDIAYIGTQTIDANGEYSFDIKFNKNINDYNVYVRQGNTNITSTIMRAEKLIDCVKIDIDINVVNPQNGKKFIYVSDKIVNYFNKNYDSYDLLYAFFDKDSNELINVSIVENNLLVSGKEQYTIEIPENTGSIKCFVWDAVSNLVPLIKNIEHSPDDSTFSDGERVIFVGDSITHYGKYLKELEHFYQTRYPSRCISFINLGIAGDTTDGILNRIDWDISPKGGDQVFILIGVNDIQTKGNYTAAVENLRSIINLFKDEGMNVSVLGGVMYDSNTQYSVNANRPETDTMLFEYKNVVKDLASELNVTYYELYDYLRLITDNVRANNPSAEAVMSNDRIHPNDAGFLIISQLIEKQQGVNPYVGYVELDARQHTNNVKNAEVTNAVYLDDTIEYDYLPHSIPLANTVAYNAANSMYNISETNNLEIIKVENLAEGIYDLYVDGVKLASYNAKQLSDGVNIACLDNNPSQVQSKLAYSHNQSRYDEEAKLRAIAYTKKILINKGINLDNVSEVNAEVERILTNPATATHTLSYVSGFKSYYGSEEQILKKIALYYENAKNVALPIKHHVIISKQ